MGILTGANRACRFRSVSKGLIVLRFESLELAFILYLNSSNYESSGPLVLTHPFSFSFQPGFGLESLKRGLKAVIMTVNYMWWVERSL